MEKRVVVTGIGALTPIGKNSKEFWDGIKENKCGIGEITKIDKDSLKVKLDAEIKDYNPEDYFDKKEAKRLDLFTQYAMVAAREAYKDSNLNDENTNPEDIATIIGSGIGGFNTIEENNIKCYEKGPARVSPLFIPMGIGNMAAGNVAIDLGLKGESMDIVTACATGTHSIGEGYRMIKHGYQKVALTGGTEASIVNTAMGGFMNMKALTQETDPKKASIPFDARRSGFVMAEGAAVIVLEELEHAKKRGAHIYAEVVGFGSTTDAYHITAPSPDGSGAARAMKKAIEDAKISPKDIKYINAHGTSTPLNDKGETKAIKLAFGNEAQNVWVGSTKGHTGHMMGAAGTAEAIVCIKAVEEDFIPITLNYKEKDPECDLKIVHDKAVTGEKVEYAMSNSLGFGGHNASIIIKKYKE